MGAQPFSEVLLMIRYHNLWNQRLRCIVQTLCLGLITVSLITQPLLATDVRSTSAGRETALNYQNNWSKQLSPDEKIHQLLNRITFGARPGDVKRVSEMGLNEFLDEQLHPEGISDAAVEARIRALPTLVMTTEE